MAEIPATGQQPANKTGLTIVTAVGAAIGGGMVAAIVLTLILAIFGVFGDNGNEVFLAPPDGWISADFAKSAADVAAPSVISIIAGSELVDPKTGYATSSPESTGSGVIISEDGYIVTNNHVVTKSDLKTPVDEVLVQLGAENISARIVGRDALNDIAVIKIDRTGLDPIDIGSSEELKAGDPIVVIGNPKGIGLSVSTGIVSATGRTFGQELYTRQSGGPGELAQLASAIQVDAMVNHGNSGGALVNTKGEWVGIPSAGLGGYEDTQGLNFCIPIGLAKGIIEDLIATGRAYHPYLGANTQTIDLVIADIYELPTEQGAIIDTIDPGSPADKAGLQPTDIIVEVDGKAIQTQLDLAGTINSKDIGQQVKLVVWRLDQDTQEWSEYDVTVALVEIPSDR